MLLTIIAAAAAIAAADGATLTADHAVAHLMRDARNQIAVRTADAAGAVRYAAAYDTSAQGDTLAVNAQAETVRITGPDSMIAQGDSTVRGPTIDLDARARRMTVEGAGRFEHTLRDAEGLPAGRVLARWADSMRFDDALGRLNALGDVSVVSTPDAYRHCLDAETIPGISYVPQNYGGLSLVNDLEKSVFAKHRYLAELKDWLLKRRDTKAALMSGSGSTMFAILHPKANPEALIATAQKYFDENLWTWSGTL